MAVSGKLLGFLARRKRLALGSAAVGGTAAYLGGRELYRGRKRAQHERYRGNIGFEVGHSEKGILPRRSMPAKHVDLYDPQGQRVKRVTNIHHLSKGFRREIGDIHHGIRRKGYGLKGQYVRVSRGQAVPIVTRSIPKGLMPRTYTRSPGAPPPYTMQAAAAAERARLADERRRPRRKTK